MSPDPSRLKSCPRSDRGDSLPSELERYCRSHPEQVIRVPWQARLEAVGLWFGCHTRASRAIGIAGSRYIAPVILFSISGMVAAILAELAQEYPEVPKWIFLTTIVGAALAWITILLRVQVTGSCLLQSANVLAHPRGGAAASMNEGIERGAGADAARSDETTKL